MRREQVRAVVVVPTEHAYGREIALGFSEAAAQRGWIAQLLNASDNATSALRNWDPHVIVLSNPRAYASVPQELLQSRVVLLCECDRPEDVDFPRVMVDDEVVGRLAAEHFAEQAIRHVLVLGYKRPGFGERRLAAFQAAAGPLGVECLGYWDQLPSHQQLLGQAVFEPLRDRLLSAPYPVGLFCLCDNWARQAVTGLRSLGVDIPNQVAVLGVDNDESFCELVQPPLSSVDVPWDRIGAAAAALAERMLRGERFDRQRILVPPTGIVRRRSTDALAVRDPDVSDAVRFIRARAPHQPIRIADVLHQVAAGRHRLHRAFRQELGRTIMQEVRRVRIDHAKRLITTTPLSLDEIAAKSGFPSYRKLTLAFRAETGSTPSQYRKRYRT